MTQEVIAAMNAHAESTTQADQRPARIVPQVNLNGTSLRALVSQQAEVLAALHDVLEALAEAAPHGRDYQTMPAGSFETARTEHLTVVGRVQAIRDDVQRYALAVQQQGGR